MQPRLWTAALPKRLPAQQHPQGEQIDSESMSLTNDCQLSNIPQENTMHHCSTGMLPYQQSLQLSWLGVLASAWP
jgi:hypothetical protein